MCCIATKFVPRLLTDAQKREPCQSVRSCLIVQMLIKNFLKDVITGDETWVYGYDVETKVQSSQRVGK